MRVHTTTLGTVMRISATKLGAALVIAIGLSLGQAGAKSTQSLQAAQWEYYISPNEVKCMSCCSGGGTLCCQHDSPCSVVPVD